VTPHDLTGFEQSMRKIPLADRTIEEYVAIVGRALAAKSPLDYVQSIKEPGSRLMPLAACKRWATFTNNTKLAKILKTYQDELRHHIPPRKERQPFTEDEMAKMVRGVGSAGRTTAEKFALHVLLRTGARSSDICRGVTREVLTLAKANGWIAQIRTKGQRLRKINFVSFEQEINQLLAVKEWNYLFELLAPARTNRPVSNRRGYRVLDLRFKNLCQACKVSLPHITHRCRHTVASRVYGKTKDLMATRNWFGWASTQTAERYSHGAQFEEVDRDVESVLPSFDKPNGKGKKGKKR